MPPSPDPKSPLPPLPGTPPSSPAATAANMKASLEDKSKYIRTMAKDMAKLSGTPAPAPAPIRQSESDNKTETFEGVSLAKEERPFFERVLSRTEKEADEPVELPSLQEASSIVGSSVPAAPASAAADAERTAILDRLRQKVSESIQNETPAPAPLPPPPPRPVPPPVIVPPPAPVPPQKAEPVSEWANIPSPAPAFAPLEETAPAPRMPQVGKESYREPIEVAAPARPTASKGPEGLHTYSSDFAKRIDTKSASTFSVLAAEQDANPAPKAPTRTGKGPVKALLTLGSAVVLLLLAGGGIYATYQFVTRMNNTPVAGVAVPTIVFADEYRKLEGSGLVLMEALAASANGALLPGNVLVTYVISEGTDGNGSLLAAPAPGGQLISALRLAAPDILLRNIAEESTVGVINAGTQTRSFFALRVDSYERTYAGMLTWEPLMARDLALLYPLYPAEQAPVQEASSASSTPQVYEAPRQAIALTRFTDTIVANHDVRVLKDTDGKTLMLYGYADKRTLLIVRDEAAFEALLARLKSE